VVELSKLRSDLVMFEEQAGLAAARLNVLLARAPEAPIGPLTEPTEQTLLFAPADLQRSAVDHQPDLQRAHLEIARAEAELSSMTFAVIAADRKGLTPIPQPPQTEPTAVPPPAPRPEPPPTDPIPVPILAHVLDQAIVVVGDPNEGDLRACRQRDVAAALVRPVRDDGALSGGAFRERASSPKDEVGRLAAIITDTFARLESSFGRLRRFTAEVS
jgi:hypothetical protein